MVRFEVVRNRSKLMVEGQSTLHPIHTSTNKLTGYFEAELDLDGQLNLSIPPTGYLEVYIEDMKADQEYIDRVVQIRLDTRRFPMIKAKLVSVSERGEGRYFAVGDISFQGVTRRAENELSITWLDNQNLSISGELTINVRDYEITPPSLMTIKIQPEVKVNLNLVVKRAN